MSVHRRPLSIVIPAAGLGSRMRMPWPKSLLQVGREQTVIGRQQAILRHQYPLADTVAVVGYMATPVISVLDRRTIVVENERYAETNVVRSIAMGLRAVHRDALLIVYGDLVFNAAAVAIAAPYSTLLVDRDGSMMTGDEVGLTVADGRVTMLGYDLRSRWGQVAYLVGRELDLFRRVVCGGSHDSWYGFEAINAVLAAGGCFRAVSPRGMKLVEIDTSRDFQRARSMVAGEDIS